MPNRSSCGSGLASVIGFRGTRVVPRRSEAAFWWHNRARPTVGNMYAVLAAHRGRSTNVCLYRVTLHNASGDGSGYRACGLCSGSKAFEVGDFIGFYTGRWGTRKELGGANPYMISIGDDYWHVAPQGGRSRRVNHGQHTMAAINEPCPGVRFPAPSHRLPRLHAVSDSRMAGNRERLLQGPFPEDMPIAAQELLRNCSARCRAHTCVHSHLAALWR